MKTDKTKLILWGIVGVLIILLFLLRGWWKPKLITGLGGYINKEVKRDTVEVYMKGKIDTTAVFTDYVKRKGIVLNPKPKIVYVSSPVKEGEGAIISEDSLKYFQVAIKDSILEGKIDIYNMFNGDLFGADLTYKTKLLHTTDTIVRTITETITLDNNVPKSEIGLGVSANTLLGVGVAASYKTKKNWQVIGGYHYNMDGVNLELNNKPIKSYGSVTILKTW